MEFSLSVYILTFISPIAAMLFVHFYWESFFKSQNYDETKEME